MQPTPPDAGLPHHVRRTLALAGPMVLTRVGLVAMSTADVVVLGRAAAEELAAYVLGYAVYDSFIAVSVGLLLGVPVLVARETGAGRDAAAGLVWRRGLVLALALGGALALVLQGGVWVFRATGQEPALAEPAGRVVAILGLALPFLAAYYVSAAFLEALHRPGVAFAAVAAGNAVNLGLNLVLVFGLGPVPPLGAPGAAAATVATFALLAVGLGLYVRFAFRARRRYGVGATRAPGPAPGAFEQARIGFAAGAAFLLEAGAFTAMALLVGGLGALALAAHGVLFQFIAITFMVAYGIAGATQVRVGNAWGRGDPWGVRLAGWTGLGLAGFFTGAAALLYAAAPATLLRLFTDEPAVIAAALPAFVWMTLALVFDGGQTVMSNACRGRGDAWAPTALHFGSYWIVMVPGAWAFAYGLGHGLAGIYQGILAASLVSLAVLAARFAWLTRERR
jgi:multidrug resistance protein, MATE family